MSLDLDAIKARLTRVWGKWPTKGVTAPGADEFGPKAWSAHGPLRCHATEQGRARGWKQANADAAFIAHAPADIGALIAEVVELRGERGDKVMTIDLDSILSRVRLTAGHTVAVLLMPHEARALVAEVERLRGENSRLRDVLGWVETQCPGKCAGVCFDALSGEHRREGDT